MIPSLLFIYRQWLKDVKMDIQGRSRNIVSSETRMKSRSIAFTVPPDASRGFIRSLPRLAGCIWLLYAVQSVLGSLGSVLLLLLLRWFTYFS